MKKIFVLAHIVFFFAFFLINQVYLDVAGYTCYSLIILCMQIAGINTRNKPIKKIIEFIFFIYLILITLTVTPSPFGGPAISNTNNYILSIFLVIAFLISSYLINRKMQQR